MTDSALAERAETFWAELSREQYRALAGLEAQPDFTGVHARYADVYAPAAIHALAAEAAVPGEEGRRARALREFLIGSYADHAVAGLLEQRMAWETRTRVAAEGESVPFRQVAVALANAADRQHLWALEDARLAALREVEALDRERFEQEWRAYAQVAGGRFLESWQMLSGIVLPPLATAARRLLDETADVYRDLLRYELPRRLGLELAEARAVARLRLERAPWFDAHFAQLEPISVARRQLGELGLEVEAGGKIQLDLEPRPAKWARAFCSVIRAPEEIVLVLSPAGGWRDWIHFFHELGHAQHFAHVDPALPFEDRLLGDFSVTEAYARLFHRLAGSPAWLRHYVGLRGAELHNLVRLAVLIDLLYLRRQAGKLLYELELHEAGRFDGMRERYVDILSAATSLRHSPESYLDDVDARLYCARYLRSWALEAALAERLRNDYDEDWFRNPRAGPYLQELFALGQREDADALARRIAGHDLDYAGVAEHIQRSLA